MSRRGLDAAEIPRRKEVAPRWAVVGIFLILAFGAAALSREFLMPLTMGILLFFVFSPVIRVLGRIGIPRPVSAGLVTAGLVVGLLVAMMSLAVPLTDALENAPRIFSRLEWKIQSLRGPVQEIQQAAEKIDQISQGGSDAATDDPPLTVTTAPADDGNILTQITRTAPALLAQLVFTLVLLYFMLASGDLLYKRIVQSFSAFQDKRRALEAMHEIEVSLGRYLGSITLINACLGVAIGVAMWLWGMPSPALFGVAGFAFNFVPYVGALAGVALATAVALVSLDGVFEPAMVGLTYFALTSLEGQLVTPYFVSRRLRLNTVVVFVAVALWAWLWSVMGMILAVPILVVLRVLCSYVPGLRSLGSFLSGQETPESEPIGSKLPGPPPGAARSDAQGAG